jgi:spore photoproduct lyase
MNNPVIIIYTNFEKIIREIRRLSELNPRRILRIGTGELTDSLAFDPVTRFSEKLMTSIQKLPNVLLELKTKTDHIDHLLDIESKKVVLSWSVNPDRIAKKEEHKAASIRHRLQAAGKAAKNGFLIGLHFDPIIHTPNWKELYLKMVDTISEFVEPNRICWISLGSLRYPSYLKDIAQARFPKTPIFSGEQISGLDGKIRYIKPIRMEIYDTIYRRIREKLGNAFIYFCMESEDIWLRVLGIRPSNHNEVDWYFAKSLYMNFPELEVPRPLRNVYRNDIIIPQ